MYKHLFISKKFRRELVFNHFSNAISCTKILFKQDNKRFQVQRGINVLLLYSKVKKFRQLQLRSLIILESYCFPCEIVSGY